MSKKETCDKEVTLADTVISQVFEGEQPNLSISELVEVLSEKSLKEQVVTISTSQLTAAQHEDQKFHLYNQEVLVKAKSRRTPPVTLRRMEC